MTGAAEYAGYIAYQHSDNKMRFGVNESDKLVILSGGNVGIGTTAPLSRLHVLSREIGNGANKGIRIENYNGSKDYSIRTGVSGYENTSLAFYDETAGANRIVIETGGEVGIGSVQPTQKLHVAGNLRVTGAYYDSNNSPGTANQVLVSTATGTDWIDGSAIPGVPGGSGTTNYLAKWTPDGDTLGIGSVFDNGNVGIGTSSVGTYKLNVDGAIRIGVSGTIQPLLSRDSSTGGLIVSSVGNSGDFIFQGTGGSEKFRIKDTGNVGIGVTSPNAPLQFSNAITTRKVVLYEMANNNNQFYGFGVEPAKLVYSTANTGDDHVFYAGASSTSRNELIRIDGSNGDIKLSPSSRMW